MVVSRFVEPSGAPPTSQYKLFLLPLVFVEQIKKVIRTPQEYATSRQGGKAKGSLLESRTKVSSIWMQKSSWEREIKTQLKIYLVKILQLHETDVTIFPFIRNKRRRNTLCELVIRNQKITFSLLNLVKRLVEEDPQQKRNDDDDEISFLSEYLKLKYLTCSISVTEVPRRTETSDSCMAVAV